MSLLDKTLLRIEKVVCDHKRPAIMSSFGKDSMVVLALCRMLKLDLDVIYHRNLLFPHKNRFAVGIKNDWNLRVHDWLPIEAGVKTNSRMIEPVLRYRHGKTSAISVPVNVLEPKQGEAYACGLADIINIPKETTPKPYPWDLLLWGQKSSDVDQFEGHCTLTSDYIEPMVDGAPALFYPIRDWSHDDVWDFILKHKIPYQTDRYNPETRKEHESKYSNNDYIPACMNCLDKRKGDTVFCPKLQKVIPNLFHTVMDCDEKLPYIQYSGRET
jgi:hypothetical protein